MSLYNLLFGINANTPLLLAVLGLRESDVERLRDVHASEDGSQITVYTRTGGGNRGGYPNLTLRKAPGWQGSVDDEYDTTYCSDTFAVPEQWRQDVANLRSVIQNGLRAEFCRFLSQTLQREPTESDLAAKAYEHERRELQRTRHFMANGHTFVPQDDAAMEAALKLAEANGGSLRSCWGIAPLKLSVRTDFHKWPNATDASVRDNLTRVEIDCHWADDEAYWQHCQKRFAETYPQAMLKVALGVKARQTKAA